MKTLILFSCFLGLVFSKLESDDEHKQLHDLASNIMQNLQKSHMPSDGLNSGTANAPIHHLSGSELISKSDKTKISIGVKGVQFVSVEANGKVVNISTTFGVGSVSLFNVQKDGIEEQMDANRVISSDEESEKEIDESLESLEEEYLSDNLKANANETKILIGKKVKFGMKVEPKGNDKSEVKITGTQGYILAAKTNVTKGYTINY